MAHSFKSHILYYYYIHLSSIHVAAHRAEGGMPAGGICGGHRTTWYSLFSPSITWDLGSNWCPQAWWEVTLPAEPSCWPEWLYLRFVFPSCIWPWCLPWGLSIAQAFLQFMILLPQHPEFNSWEVLVTHTSHVLCVTLPKLFSVWALKEGPPPFSCPPTSWGHTQTQFPLSFAC